MPDTYLVTYISPGKNEMVLEILRTVSVCLALFFFGINIAILINHYERPGIFVTLGRMGITLAIITVASLKALVHSNTAAPYLFYTILIPSFIFAIFGGVKFYKEQEAIEHPTSKEVRTEQLAEEKRAEERNAHS
jgi:hypothetical protein